MLPSYAHLKDPPAGKERGLILSAKTTLRERWKQVEREMHGSELFLGTVDENIPANAIEEMARAKGIKGFRTAYKRNARGELVVALIIKDEEGPLSSMNIP